MEAILIILLLYNVWLVLYILFGRTNNNKIGVEKKTPAKPSKESNEIIGKSLFRMESRMPISSKREPNITITSEGEDVTDIAITFADEKDERPSARLSKEKIDSAFSDIRMSEVPQEYDDDESERQPNRLYANGASFEEIGLALKIADNPLATPQEQMEAGEVFSEMKDSEFYSRLIEDNPEREKRIKGVMGKISKKPISGEREAVGVLTQPQKITEVQIPTEISEFDIRDFV